MTKGVTMKHNRPQLDAMIFEIIRPMNHMDAKELIMKRYQKNSFNKLTLEEMEDFVKTFEKPEQHSQSVGSPAQK